MNNTKHIIAKVKGKAREEYFPTIDDIMTKHPSITVVDNCLYTGGCFDSTDPLFLNEILTTEGFYLTDTDRCIKFLVSDRGMKIQKAKFRDTIYKKVKKYCKNRHIYNKDLFLLLLTYKASDNFDNLAEYLDSVKKYSMFEVAKYETLQEIHS